MLCSLNEVKYHNTAFIGLLATDVEFDERVTALENGISANGKITTASLFIYVRDNVMCGYTPLTIRETETLTSNGLYI